MRSTVSVCIVAAWAWAASPAQVSADCPLAHTHIGINPSWRPADWGNPGEGFVDPDPTDDNQLWFFSVPPVHPLAPTPGWPNWTAADGEPFLRVVPETNPFGDPIYKPGDSSRMMYTCRFQYSEAYGYGDPDGMVHLDGWHSAHGPQGAWNLESVNRETEPDWSIVLAREGTNVAEDDFFMLLPSGAEILAADGAEYPLLTRWLEDKQAWGLHEHMSFNFWLAADGSDEGSILATTFSAYDAGGLYQASDSFTIGFQVVPEPGALVLLAMGVGWLGFPQRHALRRRCW